MRAKTKGREATAAEPQMQTAMVQSPEKACAPGSCSCGSGLAEDGGSSGDEGATAPA